MVDKEQRRPPHIALPAEDCKDKIRSKPKTTWINQSLTEIAQHPMSAPGAFEKFTVEHPGAFTRSHYRDSAAVAVGWFSWPAQIPARPGLRRALLSEFDLLGEGEGVLDLYTEILDGTLDLGVAEQELDGAQVAGALVDLGCLGAPELPAGTTRVEDMGYSVERATAWAARAMQLSGAADLLRPWRDLGAA